MHTSLLGKHTCIAARCLTHSLSFASALSRATPRICRQEMFESLQTAGVKGALQ